MFKPVYTKRDPNTGERVKRKAKKWYGQFADADGKVHRVPLCTDKSAAQAMLTDIVRSSLRGEAGLRDLLEQHTKTLLTSHVEAFEKHLAAKGNSERHVRQTGNRLRRLFEGCRCKTTKDVTASRVEDWLASERTKPNKPIGARTSNAYLGAAKEFFTWMVRSQRISEHPLRHLTALSTEADVRRRRRSITSKEFEKLRNAARCGDDFRGLSGRDREVLYLTAAFTGLRASELASLRVSSLDFSSTPASVTVEAAYSKRRRRDVLPLHDELAAELKEWIAGKGIASGEKLWPGTWNERAAEMLRADLGPAGIA